MAAESEQPEWTLPAPRWQPADLGRPIPDSRHACSVCMPLWEHNVAYEEGDAEVISRFQSGYPRFFMHPLVRDLRDTLAAEIGVAVECCLPLPSERSADRCAAYVGHRTGCAAGVNSTPQGLYCVVSEPVGAAALQEFWQHSGEGISSRTAERALDNRTVDFRDTAAHAGVRSRVAELQHVRDEDVYLFPSGMAAIYAAWRITRRDSAVPIQFGFPYVDTFKILQRFDSAVPLFYPNGSAEELDVLEQQLADTQASALFCEVPGNPLLRTPDVRRLNTLAGTHGFAMVIDDTLGAMINTDVRSCADLIATSLTKFFSGAGDVLAGSLVLVPNRPRYAEFKQRLEQDYENLLADVDARILLENSSDVVARITQINRSAAALVHRLQQHPAVERVYYPTTESAEQFRSVQADDRSELGCGGLLSVLLKDAARTAPQAYDRLRISKGPNLGTNFTLCCPYTILAHYEELEFAQQCGVSPWLLRVSVGLEGTDWVIDRFTEALD